MCVVVDEKVIESNRLYVINSSKTGRAYLDKDRTAYAFLNPEEAEEFANEQDGRLVAPPAFYAVKYLNESFYNNGADKIVIRNQKDSLVLNLYEPKQVHIPTNHSLNGTISLIKEYQRKDMLRDFGKCEYILPVRIREGRKLTYAIIRHPAQEMGFLYLAFSDLDEYVSWSTDNRGYSPLRMTFERIREITGKSGMMVNPTGNRMIITAEMMKEIPVPTADTEEK